jgi:hypothetical protein
MQSPEILELGLMALASLPVFLALEGMPEGYKPPIEEVDFEGICKKYREENKVKLVDKEKTGFPLNETGSGIYGFTYSPSQRGPRPIFEKRGFQSFELHRLSDGREAIIGCVTKEDAEKLATGDFAAIKLYPEPYDNAVAPGLIFFDHIVRSNDKVSRGDGNFIEFDVKK